MLDVSTGVLARTIGGSDIGHPEGICLRLSSDDDHDDLLFVVDNAKHGGGDRWRSKSPTSVSVFHVKDGSRYGLFGMKELVSPTAICLSWDDELVFVVDGSTRSVQVFHAASGGWMNSIGGDDSRRFSHPHDVCVSPGGEWLFVFDSDCVHVLCASDGTYDTFDTIDISQKSCTCSENAGYSTLACVSPDGKHLFLACACMRNCQGVRVFTVCQNE